MYVVKKQTCAMCDQKEVIDQTAVFLGKEKVRFYGGEAIPPFRYRRLPRGARAPCDNTPGFAGFMLTVGVVWE